MLVLSILLQNGLELKVLFGLGARDSQGGVFEEVGFVLKALLDFGCDLGLEVEGFSFLVEAFEESLLLAGGEGEVALFALGDDLVEDFEFGHCGGVLGEGVAGGGGFEV